MLLCAADAVPSSLLGGARLCKEHGQGYRERLQSLKCTTVDCRHLVMTATCLEEEISSAPRVRDLGANILGGYCMFCLLTGKGGTISRSNMDQH